MVMILLLVPLAIGQTATIQIYGYPDGKLTAVRIEPGDTIELKNSANDKDFTTFVKNVDGKLTMDEPGVTNPSERRVTNDISTDILYGAVRNADALVYSNGKQLDLKTVFDAKVEIPGKPATIGPQFGGNAVKDIPTPKPRGNPSGFPTPESGEQVDEQLTNDYKNSLEYYITQSGGNPNDWKISTEGNILCTNENSCSMRIPNCEAECEITYENGNSFPPPGGYHAGKTLVDKEGNKLVLGKDDQKGENIAALQEMDPGILYEAGEYFDTASKALRESRGLSGWSALLIPEESLKAWKNTVDEVFATFYLGTEYWSSAVCGSYVDGEAHGIAFFEGAGGLSEVGAFVRASRTATIIDENYQYEYIYRIEFSVKNGGGKDDPNALDPMKFNIELKGDRNVRLFEKDQKLEQGESARKIGRESIVQDSNTFYNKACIEFNQIPYKWKIPSGGVCVPILEPNTDPTSFAGENSTSGGAGGGPPSDGIADI